MKKENQSAQVHNISPERIIDARLYEQLQTLHRVKLECGTLFAKYSQQGVSVSESDEAALYEGLNYCMRTLTVLASSKYECDVKKGGVL